MTTLHLSPALALELWREAAAQEVGIKIPIPQNELDIIKNTFYNARKGHPELQDLMLCVAPGAGEIWLVKKPQEAP